ncbi:MAG: hypothetical protein AAFR02_04485 [Pseudomonadota bacterium]
MKQILPAFALLLLVASCATASHDDRDALLAKPVDCATADADIEALTDALPSGGERTLSALQSITPVGLATGAVRREYRDRASVATGKTERNINSKIADIYETCSPDDEAVTSDP